MSAVLMTGFPGFLGSAMLPRVLARREGDQAVCLVQERWMGMAAERVAEIETAHPHTAGRISLLEGDITIPGLGIDTSDRARLSDLREVWHLAAVYDLAVPESLARRVNVDGTEHVLELCRAQSDFRRLQYVSTCYVSGDYAGEFPEDEVLLLEEVAEADEPSTVPLSKFRHCSPGQPPPPHVEEAHPPAADSPPASRRTALGRLKLVKRRQARGEGSPKPSVIQRLLSSF